MKRISSGNAKLDSILDGGFPADSMNVIMGLPGTGKTILAQQLIFHERDGGTSRAVLQHRLRATGQDAAATCRSSTSSISP